MFHVKRARKATLLETDVRARPTLEAPEVLPKGGMSLVMLPSGAWLLRFGLPVDTTSFNDGVTLTHLRAAKLTGTPTALHLKVAPSGYRQASPIECPHNLRCDKWRLFHVERRQR